MSRYATLFQVELLHDYFLNRGSQAYEAHGETERALLMSRYALGSLLDVVPDAQTRAVLAGHKMLFRTTPAGFFVATMMASGSNQPAIPPEARFRLRFALRIKDPRFFNYTELGPTAGAFYVFSNDSSNVVAEKCFLSQQVAAFDPSRVYLAGEIHATAAGATFNLFRAIRDTGPSVTPTAADWEPVPGDTFDPSRTYATGAVVLSANRIYRAVAANPGSDLGNANDWQPLDILANQYVSVADRVTLAGGLFTLGLGAFALTQATVRLFRAGQATAVAEWRFAAEQGDLDQVPLDLRGLSSGLYRLDVLDGALVPIPSAGLLVYIAPAARTGGWFGVIEIGLGSGDFALLAPDGTPRALTYHLRFLNRATRWRYIFPAAQALGPGAEVAPEPGDARTLVTAAPHPLTRFGAGVRLQADDPATPAISEEVFLPGPEPTRIRRQNAQWYSEIHLSNLPLGL